MKKAILATKVGMTQIFNEDGTLTPVTVLQAGPCVVTQIKTVENDGYEAVQVGFVDKKDKTVNKDKNGKKEIVHRHGVTKAEQGHFAKAGVTSKRYVAEFKFENADVAEMKVIEGTEITLPTPGNRPNYKFEGWYVGSTKVGSSYKVTGDVTFVAKWDYIDEDGGSSSDNERTYAIVTEDDGNGSVSVSADEASAGTRITVTVKPDAGYELDELTVTDSKNKDLKVTKRSETTYTFHMADSKVTVEASFAKDGTVQQPDTRFDDVAKNAWYYNAVEYVAENGIMSGVSAREFAPNAGFSRAMLAQTLYAMSGKPAVKAESIFADVAANAWYADAVNWAAEKGYVSGVGDGKFAPSPTPET